MIFLKGQEIFNLFLQDIPYLEVHLADNTRILENEVFEKAALRISKGLPLTVDKCNDALFLLKYDATREELVLMLIIEIFEILLVLYRIIP